VSLSTCQRVCHLPEPARRLSAQLPLSSNKTQYFGSNRSQNTRGNLVCLFLRLFVCLCVCLFVCLCVCVCLSVWDIPQSNHQASMPDVRGGIVWE